VVGEQNKQASINENSKRNGKHHQHLRKYRGMRIAAAINKRRPLCGILNGMAHHSGKSGRLKR